MVESSSANFSEKELRCKCEHCQLQKPNKCQQKAVDALQAIRSEYGKPLTITSAYRCERHPVEAKKQKPGTHNQGVAFDIAIPWGHERGVLTDLAIKHGFKGLGFANSFLHIDMRKDFMTWTYK